MSQRAMVDDVLRTLPSHGWVGRRDRALLVLSQVAGLSYRDIADLTTADVTIRGGTARIRSRTATITVRPTDDTMLCGPCALARWLHVLDMTVIYPNGCVAAAVLARSAPLVDDSPHACHIGTNDPGIHVQGVAFLPAVDPWGILIPPPAPRRRGRSRHHQAPTGLDLPWQDRHTPADRLRHRIDQLLDAGAVPVMASTRAASHDQ